MIEKDNKCSIPNCYLYRIDKLKMYGLYKIYEKNGTIFGAKLSGHIFDEESADSSFDSWIGSDLISIFVVWLLRHLLSGWVKNKINKRYELEEYYNTFEFDSITFLNKDKGNFIFDKSDISKVKIFMKRADIEPAYLNEGTIVIETNQDKPMKFAVVGKQSMRDVARIFSDLGIVIEVKDKGIFYNKF